MNLAQLRALAVSTGFPNPDLAAAVAMAESRGNPSATAIVTQEQATAWNTANPTEPAHGPERSFGLWQINTLAHPTYSESSLLDPTYNALAAYTISNGGTNWRPWSTYTSGAYRKWYRPQVFGVDVNTWVAIGIGAVGALVIYSEIYGVPKPLRRILA
jgi:hypothetical protein